MYCTKCGKETPQGSVFCNSCGAPVIGQEGKASSPLSQWGSALSMLIKLDPVLAILPVGSFLMVLGAFLPWDTGRATTLGLQTPGGAIIMALSVLFLVTLVLSRTGTPGSWGLVLLMVSALALTIIFQTIYHLRDVDHSIGAGVYVAMVGAFLTTIAGVMEYSRSRKR
jgi:hypothetical protein